MSRSAKDRRRTDLAKIHIGAKQLCGDDREAYEDMLEAIVGERSSKGLDEARRRKVLRHLRTCGAKFRSVRRGSARKGAAAAPEIALLLRKIDALLIDAGNRPRAYAEGILQRMTKHAHRVPLQWGEAAPAGEGGRGPGIRQAPPRETRGRGERWQMKLLDQKYQDQMTLLPEHLLCMPRSQRPPEVSALAGPGAYVTPVRNRSGAALAWGAIRRDGASWRTSLLLAPGKGGAWRVLSVRLASVGEALDALAGAIDAVRGGG